MKIWFSFAGYQVSGGLVLCEGADIRAGPMHRRDSSRRSPTPQKRSRTKDLIEFRTDFVRALGISLQVFRPNLHIDLARLQIAGGFTAVFSATSCGGTCNIVKPFADFPKKNRT
jgi:hypothetical protein